MNWSGFVSIVKWLLLVLTGAAVVVQLYMAFDYAPTEKYMGHVQRLMYFHVPSAITAFIAFGVVFGVSFLYLWTRNRVWDQLAVSSAEIGVLFTTLTLITGSLWARPVWNAWWVWDDPRLITAAILWFLYIAYLLIRSSVQGEERRRIFAAVFGIIAFIDVPLVYFSVKWWRTIHPKVIDKQGAHMPPEMASTLFFSMFAFFMLYLLLLWHRTQLEQTKARVRKINDKTMERERGFI